jgi:hypothetical protein
MTASRLTCASVVLVAGLLVGCATPPALDLTAEVSYCQRASKTRALICTAEPAPSLNADARAKQFSPDPNVLTVYVVRRNWGDGRKLVKVQADRGAPVETLPNTMVRYRLKPGAHEIVGEFEGQRLAWAVSGNPGEVKFIRLEVMVWAWKSALSWKNESEGSIRGRAVETRLVADVFVR